jgi:hypothetical protein
VPSPITNTGNLNLIGQGELGGSSTENSLMVRGRDEHGMVLYKRAKGSSAAASVVPTRARPRPLARAARTVSGRSSTLVTEAVETAGATATSSSRILAATIWAGTRCATTSAGPLIRS